jgi:hypothetical protein
MDASILFWILPVLFISLFLYLLFGKSKAYKSASWWKYLLLVILIGAVIFGGIIFLKGRKSVAKCPTTITPEDFTRMDFQNENSIEAVFYNKKYEIDVNDEEDKEGNKFTMYRYKLYKHNILGDKKSVDWGYYKTDIPNCVNYVIKEEDKYNAFFYYLKNLGADSIIQEDIANYKGIIGSYPSFRYKNCVFTDINYDNAGRGYLLRVSSYGRLTPKAK